MSGYNRFEQKVGTILDRFPRMKSKVETTYQRLNYHLVNRGRFEYDLHEDAELHSVEEWFGLDPTNRARFVGFYDVCPWSRDMEHLLLHEPGENTAAIVVLTHDNVTKVASTGAWNYQQGSRLQWHSYNEDWILFNDVEDRREIARVVSVDGELLTTYPQPVHAMNPTGEEYLSTNFKRADRNSPGYGYNTLDGKSLESPDEDGIVRVSLDDPADGTCCREELIIPLSELISAADVSTAQDCHYIHHILYAPGGDRFVFLHRWRRNEARHTRLYVSDSTGETDCLLENRYISHFCWLDTERLFLWGGTDRHGRGYYVLNTVTGEISSVDALAGHSDGHPSISPDGRWIVTDTYPDRARRRSLLLYNLETGEHIKVGQFLAPFGYDGTTRCDLHPRWSPDGTCISIDSTFTGTRRSYVVDVEPIVD